MGPIFVRPYTTSPAWAVSPLPPIRSATSKRSLLSASMADSSGRKLGAFLRRPEPTSKVLSWTGIDLATTSTLSLSSRPDPVTPVRNSFFVPSSVRSFTPTSFFFAAFLAKPKAVLPLSAIPLTPIEPRSDSQRGSTPDWGRDPPPKVIIGCRNFGHSSNIFQRRVQLQTRCLVSSRSAHALGVTPRRAPDSSTQTSISTMEVSPIPNRVV